MGELISFSRHRLKGKSKYELYKNAYEKAVSKLLECEKFVMSGNLSEQEESKLRDVTIKMTYYGVKVIENIPRDISEVDEIRLQGIIKSTRTLLGMLTINELLYLFPIEKEYDGKKYGTKDYFSTIEFIKKYDKNKMIVDNLHDVLWGYYNWTLIHFDINCLMALSNDRKRNGQEGLMESFAREFKLDTYAIREDGTVIKNKYKPELQVIK